ncbi:MAG TPA: Ig-like domain-containing protein [Solirubrobacteraceae bacterium]|nr:Ig-like domain-containing protein [Solirubrobacteraceae bacterium]
MARRWLYGAAAGAGMVLALILPASARAGTYTWALPTAQAPGPSNPDHDSYGSTPWTYDELTTMTTPGQQPSFFALKNYATAIQGGLTGWYDAVDSDQPYVADNRSGQTVGVVPDGVLALQPARDRLVAVAWTSPLTSAQRVTVSGTFTMLDTDTTCLGRPTWTLEQNTTVLASGGVVMGGASQAISASPTVDPGQTLYLVIGWTGPAYNQACVTAGLTLSLQAPSASPTVTLDRPSSGTVIRDAQPTFAGHASTDFGDASDITVRVSKGSSGDGSVAEKVTARRSGASYSAPATPPLANGSYTAVAEQDDAAGDAALSPPVTFQVHNVAPHLKLVSPGSRPLTTAQPTLSGTAGTAPGDSSSVGIGVYKGSAAQGQQFRLLVARRSATGRFSIRISPPLPNGTYTAVAAQSGAGGSYGVSQPVTFRVAVPPPQPIGSTVSLDRAGRAALSITCTAVAGACTGDVLVLTGASFAPVPGGPRGPVRVLFAHVEVPAGSTEVVRRTLPGYVADVLRRHAPLSVRVIASLTDSTGHKLGGSVVRRLRLAAGTGGNHA